MANLPAPPRAFDLASASSRSLDAEVVVEDKDVSKGSILLRPAIMMSRSIRRWFTQERQNSDSLRPAT
jgi:hypothetical protein